MFCVSVWAGRRVLSALWKRGAAGRLAPGPWHRVSAAAGAERGRARWATPALWGDRERDRQKEGRDLRQISGSAGLVAKCSSGG